MKKQLSDAFNKIKIIANTKKLMNPQYLATAKTFAILINRLIKFNYKTAFSKLTSNRFHKHQTYKLRTSISLISKLFK